MIQREALSVVTTMLDRHAAVGLLGPRQVGKTTLALAIAKSRRAVYLDLEDRADRAKIAEPELYLAQHTDKLVVLDAGGRGQLPIWRMASSCSGIVKIELSPQEAKSAIGSATAIESHWQRRHLTPCRHPGEGRDT